MQRGFDGRGAVQNDGGFNSLRHHGRQEGKLIVDALVGLDDVGAGLAKDNDGYGGSSIQVAGGANTLRRILYVGYVGKMDGQPIVITDNQRLVLVGLGDLAVGDDVGSDQVVRDLTAGEVGILQA